MDLVPPRLGAALCLIVAATFASACGTASGGEASGADLYRYCESCHQPDGRGDQLYGAPSIAGLPEWYVASQLERFSNGLRGRHPDDVEGLRMRPMSFQLTTESQRRAVAQYVASLPPVVNPPTLTDVDLSVGEQTYVMCIACHGEKGEGNQEVGAPPIAGLDDWYVALQIRKFRSGIRGSAPGDAIGPTMAAMSMAITPEAVDDVAAYVHSLPR